MSAPRRPAYSPDFNPIELALSTLKAAHLRGVGARTVDTLIIDMGIGLTAITGAAAVAFFRHAGYRYLWLPYRLSL